MHVKTRNDEVKMAKASINARLDETRQELPATIQLQPQVQMPTMQVQAFGDDPAPASPNVR